jgi:hypothetical protein
MTTETDIATEEVADVLRQLKQEIRRQHLQDEMECAVGVVAALIQAREVSQVNPHQPIAWPHWPGGLWPKIVALLQKVVRRLLRWYINPLVAEQNRFNSAVVTALDALARENARLRDEVRMLAARQADMATAQEPYRIRERLWD